MSYVPRAVREVAHNAVAHALRTGRLVRPSTCSRCGRRCKPDAHHADYRKPLDVEWLCRRCHNRAHENRADNGRHAFGRRRCRHCEQTVYIHELDSGRAAIGADGAPVHVGACPNRQRPRLVG